MSFFKSLAATLLLTSTASAVSTTVAYPQPSQSCVSGAHIIVARASLESQGEGIIRSVADSVAKMVPNSDSVAVVYPATEENYTFSEQEGVVGMKQLVTDYVSKCPDGKIILMGYSQGAQVVGDTVIGSDEKGFSDSTTNPTGLGKSYLDNIVALIMMGDPAYSPGCPGHVGNASHGGLFPRQNNDAFSQYGFADKMQTYCDAGDEFCDANSLNSPNALNIHLGYVAEYGSSAASYAASAFSAAGGSGGAASATGGSGSGSSSAAMTSGGGSSSAAKTSAASSAKATSAAASKAGSSSKAATSAKAGSTTSAASFNPLTSDRFHPVTGTFSGTFQQIPDLQETGNVAGVHTIEKGVAGAVFGAAMFVMGLF